MTQAKTSTKGRYLLTDRCDVTSHTTWFFTFNAVINLNLP